MNSFIYSTNIHEHQINAMHWEVTDEWDIAPAFKELVIKYQK